MKRRKLQMEKTQNQMGIMTAKKTDRKRQKKEYKENMLINLEGARRTLTLPI